MSRFNIYILNITFFPESVLFWRWFLLTWLNLFFLKSQLVQCSSFQLGVIFQFSSMLQTLYSLRETFAICYAFPGFKNIQLKSGYRKQVCKTHHWSFIKYWEFIARKVCGEVYGGKKQNLWLKTQIHSTIANPFSVTVAVKHLQCVSFY